MYSKIYIKIISALTILFLLGLIIYIPARFHIYQSVLDEPVIREQYPIVASITSNSRFLNGDSPYGFGWLFSPDAVITAKHVVSDKNVNYSLIFPDGTARPVRSIHNDPLFDISILQIDPWGDTAGDIFTPFPVTPEIGDSVILLTATEAFAGSVISLYDQVRSGQGILDFLIQADIPINPGFSGSPVVDAQNHVIGMTVAQNSENNFAFFLPILPIRSAFTSFTSHGNIVRPYLGINARILTPSQLQENGIDHGALIMGDSSKGTFSIAPNSPAARSGVKINDIILSLDGQPITPERPFALLLSQKKPGDQAKLLILRDGQEFTVQIKLGEVSS